ncbi:MAG: glycoside hydrolase family 66 protein [Clostridia bacterium]|nr:glycoside hydrolase family 66 protein [Clostridia bacterium]
MVKIDAIHFNKAQYHPGEDVLLEVRLSAAGPGANAVEERAADTDEACHLLMDSAVLSVTVTDVVTTVFQDSVAFQPETSSVKLRIPGHVLQERLAATGRLDRAIGFGLRVEIVTKLDTEAATGPSDESTDRASAMRVSAGFDVAPHWRYAPRYGFVCEFGPGVAPDPAKWQRMADIHINVVQFYDWMYRHHQLIPESNVFCDPLGRILDLGQVRRQVELARSLGIAPIAYGAMYGAEQEFLDTHPEMGAYKRDGTLHSLAGFIWIMDIARGSAWQDHIIEQYANAIDMLGFEGIHVDQYGFPKVYYTYDGRCVHTEQELAPFIQVCRDRLGDDAGLIFNAVNSWPVQEVAAAPQDIVYIEVWPPHDTYRDLRELVLRGRREAGFHKQVILAAYMRPFAAAAASADHCDGACDGRLGAASYPTIVANEPAEIALRLTSAAIMSSGGFHLVLGEGNAVLTDGYYPKYVRLRDEFMQTMKNYWEFAVRYEEFLFDLDARDTHGIEVGGTDQGLEVVGYPYGPWGEAGKVWATVRNGHGYKLLQLVNLVGVDDPRWNEPKKPPTVLHNVTIRWLLDEGIQDVLLASPDFQDASLKAVSYHERPHEHGRVIEFTVERLDYWSMVIVRQEGLCVNFAS